MTHNRHIRGIPPITGRMESYWPEPVEIEKRVFVALNSIEEFVNAMFGKDDGAGCGYSFRFISWFENE